MGCVSEFGKFNGARGGKGGVKVDEGLWVNIVGGATSVVTMCHLFGWCSREGSATHTQATRSPQLFLLLMPLLSTGATVWYYRGGAATSSPTRIPFPLNHITSIDHSPIAVLRRTTRFFLPEHYTSQPEFSNKYSRWTASRRYVVPSTPCPALRRTCGGRPPPSSNRR